MSEEIWKPVTIGDGYFAQRFSVSNQGRVKNHETGRILHSAIWPIPKAHLSINGYGSDTASANLSRMNSSGHALKAIASAPMARRTITG